MTSPASPQNPQPAGTASSPASSASLGAGTTTTAPEPSVLPPFSPLTQPIVTASPS